MTEHSAAGSSGEFRGPLAGLVVVDLSRALAGPHAGMMLGDLGARVIKVESPEGDDSRGWGPPFLHGSDGREHASYFLSCNRNKESVAADLKSEVGRAVLTALVARADVLIENFRPGVLDRLGFGVARLHEINPRLVILSITGFGHDGPEGTRPGYDQIAQGEGGIMSVTGPSPDQPTRVGVPIGDIRPSGTGQAGARSSAPACSPRPSARTPTRAPGTRLPGRCQGPAATITRPSARTGYIGPPTGSSRSQSAATRCGRRWRPRSASTGPSGR